MTGDDYAPGRCGLLLIDTVNEVFDPKGKGHALYKDEFARIGTFGNLRRLLAGVRERDVPVFFSGMSYSNEEYTRWGRLTGIHRAMFDNRLFEAGSWATEFHPELSPGPGEVALAPHKNIDVFASTDLDAQLRHHGVEFFAVAGMIGTMCVESTARAAMERGYHVTTIPDATASDAGPAAYDAMVARYPLFSHATRTVDEYLRALDEARR
ncbi:cysteine hydrolase family protein [Catellatospora chokoriensis]|uniref:Isochorismatase n=1 Tax=Catellatospora chokoriensis TaxID=310353 RepID=A0A8J3JZ38_9ACTN|nr:cysteine hydrolase [Catellatospora chokoriensis]GIF89866.1 isochorismatase [Catellatospora chokoriensis]